MQDLSTLAFDELRLSARCDKDVLQWLQYNAHVLPNVATPFVPYVKVDMDTFSSVAYTDDGSMVRNLSVSYRAQLPSPTMATFKEMANCEIRAWPQEQITPKIQGVLEMALDVRKWPYASTLIAYQILSGQIADPGRGLHIIKNFWQENYPHITWETLEKYASTDLLPHDDAAFACLVLDKTTLDFTPAIPQDLAP